MDNPTPETTPKSNIVSFDTEGAAAICYFLNIAFFLFGVTPLVGVIIAYVKKGDADEYWLQSHYTYIIRTFWITLLYVTIGIFSLFLIVGFAIIPAAGILFLVRTIIGLNLLYKKQEIPNPQSWFI
jgi:uncharacterized membrane protein